MLIDRLAGIVDSGFAHRQSPWISDGQRFALEQDSVVMSPAQADQLGHGTDVIDAFTAEAGPVQLCVAQVFSARGVTSPLQLAAAILWLIERNVRLINLSLGLRNDRPSLRNACLTAIEAGVIVCASSPAQGAPVFPASYPGVLRFTGDARCEQGQWSYLNTPQADFGGPVRTPSGAAGASIACAALSGRVARFLHDNAAAGREEVTDYLRQGAAFVGPERRRAQHD